MIARQILFLSFLNLIFIQHPFPFFFSNQKEREVERKKNLAILLSRTREQILEEEILYTELKRREANETKWAKERENLLRTFKFQDTSAATAACAATTGNTSTTTPTGGSGEIRVKKKKKASEDRPKEKKTSITSITKEEGNQQRHFRMFSL